MKTISGSFTLEAAIVFPMALVLIYYIIHLSFFLHDTVTATSEHYRILIAKSEEDQSLSYRYHDSRFSTFNEQLALVSLTSEPVHTSENVTFTNYNNTNILLKYLVGKKIKNRKDTTNED